MLGDITNGEDLLKLQMLMNMNQADVVLSDIAPEISGDRDYDAYHITRLNNHAISVAGRLLRPGGNLLMKTFQGPDEPSTFKFMEALFKEVYRVKPHASRKRSPELYLLGKGYKLTEYFNNLKRVDNSTMTFDQLYSFLPLEYTKSREEFKARLIYYSQILEKTGVESSCLSSSDTRHEAFLKAYFKGGL